MDPSDHPSNSTIMEGNMKVRLYIKSYSLMGLYVLAEFLKMTSYTSLVWICSQIYIYTVYTKWDIYTVYTK